MRLRLTLLLYNLLIPLFLPVLLCAMLMERKRREGSWASFAERFGRCRPEVRVRLKAGRGRHVWINAGSVGEVNVAQKLIAELVRREPGRPLILSVTTSSGRVLAEEHAPPELTVITAPLDLPIFIRRLVRRIKPAAYVPVESELWPNLLRAMQKERVPVLLANARLSPRSEGRYRKVRALIAPVFAMLDRVLVQETPDASRWQKLGVPADRIHVTGSIKYDFAGGGVNEARAAEFRSILEGLWGHPLPPVLMAASTHDGEEKAIAAIYLELRPEYPELRMVVVPRHVERRETLRAELESLGLTTAFRSTLHAHVSAPEILIVDSTGELGDWQSLATVVIIGRSFLATGGQNPAEATGAGVPVITGPHMENFLPLMELLGKAGGILTVPSLTDLPAALRRLLSAPEEARATAARGRAALEQHRGATYRTAGEIDTAQ